MSIPTSSENFFSNMEEEFIENNETDNKIEIDNLVKIAAPVTEEKSDSEINEETQSISIDEEIIESTIIEKNCCIEGDIKSKGNIFLKGIVKGTIKTSQNISISDTGNCDNGLYAKENIEINKQNKQYMKGPLQGKCIRINNTFLEGNIKAADTVYINSNSVIIGDISAKNLILEGAVQGNITIDNNIDLKDTAVVKGTITTATINMDEKATLECTLTLTNKNNIDIDHIFNKEKL